MIFTIVLLLRHICAAIGVFPSGRRHCSDRVPVRDSAPQAFS
jgi:hypothetical protein